MDFVDAQLAAQLTLALYAAVFAAVVAGQIARSGVGTAVWLLYVVQRLYGGLWFHWRSNRRCPFPERGPGLIIANHRSPVDPLMLWMNHHLGWESGRLRIIHFLMAREYAEHPGLRWLCRTMRTIPVERQGRDMGPVREALGRLKAGELVGVFPEGRINRGERLLPAGEGVAWLALRAQVPVYPVFIQNAPQGQSMVEPFLRPSRVRVVYGEPIDLSHYHDRRKSPELLREVTDLLMARLAEVGGVAYHGSPTQAPAEEKPLPVGQ